MSDNLCMTSWVDFGMVQFCGRFGNGSMPDRVGITGNEWEVCGKLEGIQENSPWLHTFMNRGVPLEEAVAVQDTFAWRKG